MADIGLRELDRACAFREFFLLLATQELVHEIAEDAIARDPGCLLYTSMGFILTCLICVLALSACGGSAQASDGSSDDTSGDPFTSPAEIELSSFNAGAATSSNNASIDTSSASKGYVGAAATSSSRLKLQVTKDGQSMHYDMPSDGTPIIVPLDMGSGTYTIGVMPVSYTHLSSCRIATRPSISIT